MLLACLTLCESWEQSGWKAPIEVAERMLRHMHDANLIMSASVSKYSALQTSAEWKCKFLTSYFQLGFKGWALENKPSPLFSSFLTSYFQPEILLKSLAARAELLLVLSLSLFWENLQITDWKKYFPLSLLPIKTCRLGR